MTVYREPPKQASRRSIGNLDGTSNGIGGTDTVRIQSGSGDFMQVTTTVVENSYVSAKSQNLDIKIQNIGRGAGPFARKEADGITYSFRRITGADGVSVIENGDTITIAASAQGVDRFVNLKDAPSTFVGQSGKTLVVDEANNRLVFQDFPVPVTNFLALTDSPDSFLGQDGKTLVVDESTGKLKFQSFPTPITNFLALTDTPDSYASSNGKFLRVNSLAGQIEFADVVIPDAGNKITFAESPPTTNVNPGDGWWNTTDGSFYLYYQDSDSGQWIESGASEPAAIPQDVLAYDYGSFFEGQPQSDEILYRWRAPRAHKLYANFDGCLFTAGILPTGNFTARVMVNGAQVGTWTIAPSGAATMVSSVQGDIMIPANQEIKVLGPTATDGTVADLVVTFKGERY